MSKTPYTSIEKAWPPKDGQYLWLYKGVEPVVAYWRAEAISAHNFDFTHWMEIPHPLPHQETIDED